MAITRIKNNQITDQTITNVKIASGTLTGDLMNPQLTFNSNLTLNGNLIVTGNVTAVQSSTTQITDPLITLGQSNPGTSYDLGTVLIRGSGGNRFMGWKESASAFVFINTTEDGTTAGNIATTAYSNVIFGNATTIGSSTFSGITLSGNTVSAVGGLVLNSGSGTTTLSNAVAMNSTLSVASTLAVQGTATVNALVSNGAIQGTTLSASGNATVNALTVNASAVIGTTLQAVSGIQNTVIGNTTAAAGYFTTLQAATSFNTGGTATVNSLVSNGAIQGTEVTSSGNATVNALTVNASAVIGTTLQAVGGIQNTVIGNTTAAAGYFTTVNAVSSITSNGTITALSTITGAGFTTAGTTQVGTLSVAASSAASRLVTNGALDDWIGANKSTGNVFIGGASQTGFISVGNATTTSDVRIASGATGTGNAKVVSIGDNGLSGSTTTITVGATAGTGTLTVGANTTVNIASTSGTALNVGGNIVAGNTTVLGTASFNQIAITGGLQNTPIGNATPSTGNFTTLTAGTSFNTSGTATVNALVSNGAIQGTAITGSGVGTFASLVSNGAIQGTTIGGSGNATVAGLTVNASAVVGTTLQAVGGIQNTTIGNVTPSPGTFTKLTATGDIVGATTISVAGASTLNSLTVNNAATVGTTLVTGGAATLNSLAVNNAATVGTTLVTGGTATVNALVSNTSIGGASLSITGNAVVGNLTVQGNLITVNSQTLVVIDPIIELNTGPNGAPLTTDNNFDAGIRTHYYDTADRSAFFGRTDNTGFFEYYSNVTSETGNVIVGTYGTIKTGNLQLTGLASVGTTLAVAGNATVNALSVNNSATVGTTLSASAGIQATVIGNVTAAAGYFTTTNATGNATVNALTVNGASTVGSTLGVTGNVVAGNVSTTNITAANGTFTNNLTVAGTLTATSNVVANSSGIFFGNTTTGLNAIYAGLPVYTVLPNVVAQFTTNVNNYSQLNIQNLSSGKQASGDLVITADNGTDTSKYLDLGIASSTYNYAGYSAYYPNDGYLLIDGGNLLLNVEKPDKAVRFVVGSYDETELVAYIDNVHLAVSKTTSSTNRNNGALTVAGGAGIAGAVNTGSTLNVVGTATVNALVSNGAIQGTTISGSGTGTFASVVSNGAIQGTAITGSGAGTFASVVSNGAIQGTAITGSGAGTFASVVSNGAIQGTTIGGSGNATVAALAVNGSATIGTTLSATAGLQNTVIGNATSAAAYFTTLQASTSFNTGGTSTVNALVSNGAIQGTTIGGSGNATVAALAVNGSATVGATLSATAGIQNTPIGNVTASTGAFTTLAASGLTTVTNSIDSTGTTTGAVVVSGGLGVAKALNVGTTATLGNITFSNTTISSNLTNTGLTINSNGTGQTTFNSGLNNSKTVINGTTANTFVISGTQVGVNTASFISGATFQINAPDAMLLPVGAQGDRPGTPQAGMFRYSTTQGAIEWYTGSAWQTAAAQTTVAVANTQSGNGSATIFTLPVANASTAGTIVSINGIVQTPVSAYSVSGNEVTFTEAPLTTDVVDFRILTTTTSVSSVVDVYGTTGLFVDTPDVGNKIITFKTNGSESMSIQANTEVQVTGNVTPKANVTYSLGTSARRWKDLWLSGSTIYLGNVQIKEAAGTLSFYAADGITPAPVQADVTDAGGIQNTPIGNATPSTGAFTTLNASGQITSTLATGTAPFSVSSTTKVTNLNVEQVDGFHAEQAGTVNTIVVRDASGYANVAGLINSGSSGTGNIGSVSSGFNTVFAKATSAQYADLAENYLGDAYYEPGTVVEFGGDNEVTISNTEMSSRIAGVVSTNPAYLMNSNLDGFATPVALQGRVPCFVKGKVRKGDMMVSAGNGFARAESKPVLGSVIGKALENFDGDTGVIEVVVGRL